MPVGGVPSFNSPRSSPTRRMKPSSERIKLQGTTPHVHEQKAVAIEAERAALDERAQAEEIRLFYSLLETLDDDKREVFVLAELEQMSVPEIADTLSLNVNTVYSRLRAARQAFERALSRCRAQQNMGSPR